MRAIVFRGHCDVVFVILACDLFPRGRGMGVLNGHVKTKDWVFASVRLFAILCLNNNRNIGLRVPNGEGSVGALRCGSYRIGILMVLRHGTFVFQGEVVIRIATSIGFLQRVYGVFPLAFLRER